MSPWAGVSVDLVSAALDAAVTLGVEIADVMLDSAPDPIAFSSFCLALAASSSWLRAYSHLSSGAGCRLGGCDPPPHFAGGTLLMRQAVMLGGLKGDVVRRHCWYTHSLMVTVGKASPVDPVEHLVCSPHGVASGGGTDARPC